ncbi:putative lysosomal cobalamin transporter-like protein, partial [Dinothrombium tinctorium]
MALPDNATLEIVLVFIAVLALTALFSFLYLRRYKNPYDCDASSFVTSVIGLAIVLITSALTPIDIFIISYMKYPNGTWKEWAANFTQRTTIENDVMYSYYALYGVIFAFIFIILPFMYFFYEEKAEDGFEYSNRCCNALKFSFAFLFVATVLLLLGAFVPLKKYPNSTTTEWEKLSVFIETFERKRGEDALSMVLNILCVIGMIHLVFYTGFGLFSYPIGLIRGTKSAKQEFEEIQDKHLANQTRINMLRDKERISGRLSAREKRQLCKLEEDERQIIREEQLVDQHRKSLRYKCRVIIRPAEITFGIATAILSLLIWISLLLTNIDKAMHSDQMKMGYYLPKSTLPNPIDIVLTYIQRVFPLDYVFVLIITWFLVLATFSGMRNLGVRFCLVKMYKLRVKRTRPQGLLMACALLMLIILAFNVFFYSLTPQYATYGSEHYNTVKTEASDGIDHKNVTINNVAKSCPNEDKPEDCIQTRNSVLITRFFYKAWIFGALFYWSTWAFLGFSALSLIYLIIRKSRSVTHGMLDDDDDLEESDEL